MKFTKKFLQGLAWDDYDGEEVKIVQSELIDTTRWSLVYEMVFKKGDKYYKTSYSTGATENQDESPYEYDDDEIECREVFPKEKTIIVYETA